MPCFYPVVGLVLPPAEYSKLSKDRWNKQDWRDKDFRHTAATLLYQQGGVDIRVLQQMLGHVNLGTTEIYTHTSSQQLKEAAESSPLKNVRPSHIAKDDKK